MAKNASEMFDEEPSADALFEAPAGEAGGPGHDQYKGGEPESDRQRAQANTKRAGNAEDFRLAFADKAALGGGPQIAGAIGALANAATQGFQDKPTSDLDAYRSVRDDSAKDIALAEETNAGDVGGAIGMLATPIPGKPLPKGAGALKHAVRGGKVGAGAGALHGALNSEADLTKTDDGWGKYASLLKDTVVGGVGGGLTGAATGGALGALEKPARQTARKLPLDMLGVTEPARRAMESKGISDASGDALLELIRPGRSGMRKGSLTEDAVAALGKRGQGVEGSIDAIDAVTGGKTVSPDSMAVSVLRGSKPYTKGGLQSKDVAGRMGDEAENLLASLGDEPISLADAERFKSEEFGPAVAKELKMAGEPASKTKALADTYRAIKTANEAAAANVDPALARDFMNSKEAYQVLAAPLEGANALRSGMKGSDFDWGEALSTPDTPLIDKLAQAGVPRWMAGAVVTPLNLAGRAYGRGATAKGLELLADKATQGVGGGAAGTGGDFLGSKAADALGEYLDDIKKRPPDWEDFAKEKKK